jgi:DNA-directed RNA polymerase beta subunit
MNPHSEDPEDVVALRNLDAAVYKAIAERNLSEVPSVTAFNRLINGGFRKIVEGVKPYSTHNITVAVHQMTPDNPPKVVGYSIHYVGIWGIDLGPQHLPGVLARKMGWKGESAKQELEEMKQITPHALARALCSRDGRSVCDGKKCTRGDMLGHEIFFPSYEEAQALSQDFVLPIVLGIRQHVFETRPGATAEEVEWAATAIDEASVWTEDERGCYLFNLVSEGVLSAKNGGPMMCVEEGTDYRFVTRIEVPCVVGAQGTGGDPRDGQFIMGGARKTVRNLVQGPTSQIQVRPEPNSKNPHGSKASMRRHAQDGDWMVVQTFYVTDTTQQGGSHKLRLLKHDSSGKDHRKTKVHRQLKDDAKVTDGTTGPRYGMWVGATWMIHAVPLALLFMALGVVDDKTLLHLCGYFLTKNQEQRKGILRCVEAARSLLATADWITKTYVDADGNTIHRPLAEQARIFFVEQAARLNRHQNFGTGANRNFEAMIHHFYEVVMAHIIDGIREYDSLARLGTLQWMAARVVLCTRDQLEPVENITGEPENRYSDINHWGEMDVYTIEKILGQEIRKGLRRSMGTQMSQICTKLEEANWDTHNMIHGFKIGDGSNSIRQFIVTQLEVERRKISGLAVISDKSPLQAFSDQYTLYKEHKEQIPADVRALHNTGYGIISPNETPEGETVGLINKMAIGAVITTTPPPGTDRALWEVLADCPSFATLASMAGPRNPNLRPDYLESRPDSVEAFEAIGRPGVTRVVKDGIVIGVVKGSIMEVIRHVRRGKRTNPLLRYVSVCYYHGAIVIQTKSGRLGRYMLVMTDEGKINIPPLINRLLLGSFADLNMVANLDFLLDQGVLEFVSALEAESIKIVHGKPKITPVAFRNGRLMEDPHWIESWKAGRLEELRVKMAQAEEQIHEARVMMDELEEMRAAITEIDEFVNGDVFDIEQLVVKAGLRNKLEQQMGLIQERNPEAQLAQAFRAFNDVNADIEYVSSRRPKWMDCPPDMPYRLHKEGHYLCAEIMDSHRDPHPELILGIGAACTGFTGFNKSPREAINTIHTTHAIAHPPSNIDKGMRFATRMTRDTIDDDLCMTKSGAYAPTPGKTVKLVAIISEKNWLSEDAQGANTLSNEMDERSSMAKWVQTSKQVTARMPCPATDDIHDLILCFPGQKGEAQQLRGLRAAGEQGGVLAGFMEYDIDENGEKEWEGELFEFPGLQRHKYVNYSTIGADGLPFEGTVLHPGDAVMGLIKPETVEELGRDEGYRVWYRDVTITWDQPFPGSVKKVVLAQRADGTVAVKVNVRIHKPGETVGDKFSLPIGQKGVNSHLRWLQDVFTISSSDPFVSGLVVERTFGPHGYSRMTKALFLMMCVNWLALKRGHWTRGTFGECKMTDADIVELRRQMKKAGLNPNCTFNLVHPETGEMIRDVFVGYVCVTAQPHWADFKCRSTAYAMRDIMTRQPVKGQGMRIGEMERDAFLAHGAACVLRDRLFWCSDASIQHVCEKCGLPAVFRAKTREVFCVTCGDSFVVRTQLTYGAKLLFQELNAMCIAPRFQFEEVGERPDEFIPSDVYGAGPSEPGAGTTQYEPEEVTADDLRLSLREELAMIIETMKGLEPGPLLDSLQKSKDNVEYELTLL